MSKPSITFAVSERVTHFQYGPGTIAEVGTTYTTIDFDENGRRKFVTTMVQLEPTTTQAPAPPPKRAKAKAGAKTAKGAK